MILSILDEVSAASGSNEKLRILKEHADNDVLKEVFRLTYDNMTQFYIKKIPQYTSSLDAEINLTLNNAFLQLKLLSYRDLTGNNAVNHLKGILENVFLRDAVVIERIIGRDLRIGCSSNTANKVWPGLIEKFPCMLCESFSEKNLKKIHYPALIQEKCDGARVCFVVNKGVVRTLGRSGKEIHIHGALDQAILDILDYFGVNSGVIDGELLMVDDSGAIQPREIGNGMINRAIRGKMTKEESKFVVTKVWDYISIEDFSSVKNAKGTIRLSERDEKLFEAVDCRGGTQIFTPQSKIVESLDEAMMFYADQLSQGNEGAVLKNLDTVWENRRSRNQVKLKIEECVELRVIDKAEGQGNFKGNLGALVCQSEDGGLLVKVSGMNLKQRTEFWDSDEIVGQVITVKANDYQKGKNKDTYSLFLPRFVEERLDKSTANTTEEILECFDTVYNRSSK